VPAAGQSEDYDAYYSESNLSVPEFIRARLREIIDGFGPYRRSNRLLDIGFGAGTMLETAREMKWDVAGLEVSKPAVDYARKQGFEVFRGSLSEANYPDGHFDVVTSSEILEHLPDPNGDLREIARILRPGGLLWATTPSATGLSFRLMKLNWTVLSPPEHIQLYSKNGVRLMLRKAGFAAVRLRTAGLNPMEIVNHFRNGNKPAATGFDRVEAAYQLNESLTRSPARKLLKKGLNASLNIFGLGDSLKIYARTR
jgi:SAM-dependent methyltransferase